MILGHLINLEYQNLATKAARQLPQMTQRHLVIELKKSSSPFSMRCISSPYTCTILFSSQCSPSGIYEIFQSALLRNHHLGFHRTQKILAFIFSREQFEAIVSLLKQL